jgi:hypothetical protein
VEPDEAVVRDLAEEAQPLAVRAVTVRETEPTRLGADILFGGITDGERRSGHLVAGHLAQEVGLVLDAIGGAQEPDGASLVACTGVVAGRDPFEPASDRVRERAELDPPVAEHVGARREAPAEGVECRRDDEVEILALQGDDLERHIRHRAHLAHDAKVVLPRAVAEEREVVLEPDLEVEGRQRASVERGETHERHRRVDAPGDEYGGALHRTFSGVVSVRAVSACTSGGRGARDNGRCGFRSP